MPNHNTASGSNQSRSKEPYMISGFAFADIHPLKMKHDHVLRPSAEQYDALLKEWTHLQRESSEDGPPEDDELVIRKTMVRDRMGLEFQARTYKSALYIHFPPYTMLMRSIDPCRKMSVGEIDWRIHAAAIYLARARRIGIGSMIRHFDLTGFVLDYNHSFPKSSGLKAHIARAEGFKEDGNQLFRRGNIRQALRYYIRAFASLVPYISDPCLMSFEQARAMGLLQLEYILMLNTLRALVVLGKDPDYFTGHIRDFGAIGRLEANKTYISYKARYTLLHLCARLELMHLDPPPMVLTEKDWQTYEQTSEWQKTSFEWVHGYCCEQELVMLLGPDFEGQDLYEAIHHPEAAD